MELGSQKEPEKEKVICYGQVSPDIFEALGENKKPGPYGMNLELALLRYCYKQQDKK